MNALYYILFSTFINSKTQLLCHLEIFEWRYLHNGQSADPIHFMFRSRVGFSRVGGSNSAIFGSIKPSWRPWDCN